MKSFIITFIVFTFLTGVKSPLTQTDTSFTDSTGAEFFNNDSTVPAQAPKDSLPYPLDRVVPNDAFHVGEKLTFIVRYGIIKAGEATMEVESIVPIRDRTAYKLLTKARSAKTFDWIFKVRDQVESWLDTKGVFSWKYVKKLREGGYKFDLLVDYDQYYGNAKVHEIRYEDEDPLRIRDQKEFEMSIPPYVLDVLGAFYYVRTQNLRIGVPIYMTNHDNAKTYELKVIVQRRETIEVSAGKFRCIMVEPQLRGDAIFQQKGELWVWLTDDQYKIPVQMKSAVFIGSITTELKKIEGIQVPLPSQLN